MSEQIQTFNNPEFGNVSTIEIDSKIYFYANGIASALGYNIPKDAISRHCKGALKHRYLTDGGYQEAKFIPEGDVYRLIIRSKLPSAEKFERWVFDEVLPSIRKHGAYMTQETIEKAIYNPDFLLKLVTELKNAKDRNQELTQCNQNLLTENKALSKEATIWDSHSALNALIRAYAYHSCGGNFANAWDKYYKELRYSLHMDLKIRKGRSSKKIRMIDTIKEREFPDAIKVAVAMCVNDGIDTGKVLNGATNDKYQEVQQ